MNGVRLQSELGKTVDVTGSAIPSPFPFTGQLFAILIADQEVEFAVDLSDCRSGIPREIPVVDHCTSNLRIGLEGVERVVIGVPGLLGQYLKTSFLAVIVPPEALPGGVQEVEPGRARGELGRAWEEDLGEPGRRSPGESAMGVVASLVRA